MTFYFSLDQKINQIYQIRLLTSTIFAICYRIELFNHNINRHSNNVVPDSPLLMSCGSTRWARLRRCWWESAGLGNLCVICDCNNTGYLAVRQTLNTLNTQSSGLFSVVFQPQSRQRRQISPRVSSFFPYPNLMRLVMILFIMRMRPAQ